MESNLDKVYVNSDCHEILSLAEKLGAEPYLRDVKLSRDDSTQDDFNYDFLKNIECDAMVLVNPVCPLTSPEIINEFLEFTQVNSFETCFTTVQHQLHTYFEGQPLNFDQYEQLPPTQNISPIDIISWNLAYWDKEKYLFNMEHHGNASTRGKLGLFPIENKFAVKVSHQADFELAEFILREQVKNDF